MGLDPNSLTHVVEESKQFESRKQDHIRLSLQDRFQTAGQSGLDKVVLPHSALPELDIDEVQLESEIFGETQRVPLLISSMTAGHLEGIDINERLARAASELGWLMGVGSQRKELFDGEAKKEWAQLRKRVPGDLKLIGNLGLAQVIRTPIDKIRELVDSLQATALFVHTNPLQEALQVEGTPYFKGGMNALGRLCFEMDIPVILKETGCGFSVESLRRLNELGLYAVDVAGLGGTHWGRIEGGRNGSDKVKHPAAESFANWGISTYDSLVNAESVQNKNYQVWASGGIRNGLDVAKCISLGAECVGLAQPLLVGAVGSELKLRQVMTTIEYELRVAMFCSGSKTFEDLRAIQRGRR